MGDRTGIQWTDATWNPVTGCSKMSTGCEHCYAAKLARTRLRHRYTERLPAADTRENRADPFAVRLWPERLAQPSGWRARRRVFVNSMSDMFHRDIPDAYVVRIFKVMLSVDRHVYQVLTKLPARATRFWKKYAALLGAEEVPPHIWMGVSVENAREDYRIRQLKLLPASVRFVSCEPVLGPITLDLDGIHWVIVGGESGAGHRPMQLPWARAIREQCLASEVPFFFKQIGGRTPKSGGRLLDGREWNEMPLWAGQV